MDGVVLSEEFDVSIVACPRRTHLQMSNGRVTVLEADRGAVIEAEEPLGEIAQTPFGLAPEVAVEAMRQMEIALVFRQPEGRRKIHDGIVRFGEIERRIVVARSLRRRDAGEGEDEQRGKQQSEGRQGS